MLFSSSEFLFVYLPVVLAGFFALARIAGPRVAAAWLVLVSFFFYGFWRIEDVPLLLASIAFNYLAGRLIQRSQSQPVRERKLLLGFSVGVNLLVLAYFKYASFLLGSVAGLTSLDVPAVHVTLPIGISFFTFTQIAYLVDSHRGKVEERNPVHYALFVTYFPHLIAGPVLHHAEMMPQFADRNTYRPHTVSMLIGLAFLTAGLAKKVLIADSVAPLANALFDTVAHRPDLGLLDAWEGVTAYTVQIYFDFSGYSDMAIGMSLLLGIRLPYNFASPYKARSIVEFWRCWHITLSRFLRDYLYIPLGGNRHGPLRRYLNLAITMLLGGLWHGASWTFVVWGGLHGLFLAVNHGWRALCQRHGWSFGFLGERGARIVADISALALTLLAVMVAWVFFRAASFTDAARILLAMVGAGPGQSTGTEVLALTGMSSAALLWLLGAMAFALLAPNTQQVIDQWLKPRLEAGVPTLFRDLRMGVAAGAMTVGIVMMALVSTSRNITEFIYFNF